MFPAPVDEAHRTTARHLVFALLLAGAAALLRFHRLEFQSLWNDEMFSFDVALSPFGDIASTLASQYHHPPLFFYIVHVVLKLFGPTAAALRSVSALSGSLTVGLAYLLAHRLFGSRAGLLAALLLLVAPFHLAYSQEGRPYALAAFLAVASCYTLFRAVTDGEMIWIPLYGVATLALLYTHHWGLFVLASEIAAVFLVSGIHPREKVVLAILWLVMVILYVPGALTLHKQMAASDAAGWFWVRPPSPAEAVRLLTAFSGTSFALASSVFRLPAGIQVLGGLALALCFLGTIVMLIRSRSDGMMILLTVFNGTLLIPFAISFFKPEVFLWYRYTVIPFPLLSVLIAGTVFGRRESWEGSAGEVWRTLAGAAATVLVFCGLWGTLEYFTWQKSNARDVASYVGTVASADTVKIVIRPRAFAPLLNYYYKGDATQYDEAYLNTPLGDLVDTASSFIYISLDVPNEIRDYMDGHFEKVASRRFPGEAHMGMVVGVYRQKPEM